MSTKAGQLQGEALIATTTDFRQGAIYFDAADDALLGYLFGADTVEQYLLRVGTFLEDTTLLFNRFMTAAHSLIPAALHDMGCYVKASSRPEPPPPGEADAG